MAHRTLPLAAPTPNGVWGGQPIPLEKLVFLVFLVFRIAYKPVTVRLAAMEHNRKEGGTLGVLNTIGVP